ncbi:oxidoreductase [Paenibacillus sp. FSL H7-0326]|uniref:SDR family NAD(P)-dependent oxidoreductase n=1 Tax=Paenibacillus sp. FSL H7-0326 TaxID=1921144 RepID=UPI00096F5346|nr:SDR family NAD(P)-dependent oxidoreductase [Paenibacillus sp. FSL H7-0326]OMC64852.1 oxidoreductase [Paenibacillus sp. FSL H7-0326]
MKLKDKVILITGASSGIGAICAQKLSEQGALPVLLARSEDKLQKISASITGTPDWYPLDVTDNVQVEALIKTMIDRYGQIDVVLNNAGYGQFEMTKDMTVAAFEQMMDVNYMGIVRMTKAVLPHMLASRQGHIVNVASMAGKIGTAKSASYTATKHAVLGFSNALRQELRETGIKVTTINPGPIDTPFFETADPGGSYISNLKGFIMQPEYVADKMVQAIIKQKEEVNLPHIAAAGIKLYQLFPRLADKLTYGLLNRK